MTVTWDYKPNSHRVRRRKKNDVVKGILSPVQAVTFPVPVYFLSTFYGSCGNN